MSNFITYDLAGTGINMSAINSNLFTHGDSYFKLEFVGMRGSNQELYKITNDTLIKFVTITGIMTSVTSGIVTELSLYNVDLAPIISWTNMNHKIDGIGSGFYYSSVFLLDDYIQGNNFADVIKSNSGNDTIYSMGGNDKVYGETGNDMIDGGTGIDTIAFSGGIEQYNVNIGNYFVKGSSYTLSVSDNISYRDGTDVARNIERIQFVDGSIALDIYGNAGQAYRIYQAAFNRTPDSGGLGFWIKQLDNGNSLHSIAESFVGSIEFKNLYGSSQTNANFVDALYRNILHRPGDQVGIDYWTGLLSSGEDKADVLVSFSESGENKTAVIGSIQNGIHYTEWMG